jgi:uncharacterized membrane protein YdjX (TVP38/TMEM64 family)
MTVAINKDLIKPIALIALVLVLLIAMRLSGAGEKLVELRFWLQGLGFLGPVVFAAIFAVSTVAAVPGSAMSIAAGAMFGSVAGIISVSAGSTAGAGLAFLVARYAAREPVRRWLSRREKFKKLDDMVEKQGAVIVAITRLIPLFPFTLLNYGFGLTNIRFSTYLFWSWLCMLPGTVLYVAGSDILFKVITRGKLAWTVPVLFVLFGILLYILIKYARKQLKEDSAEKRS